jgi:hypothetical protein
MPVDRDVSHKYTYVDVRATSPTRLRARDCCNSSTLIGGISGAGPSLLHTTLEGPTEYVKFTWVPTCH